MAFIRVKRIKGKKYAYVVENSWRDKKVKQKVKKYIGRVHELSRQEFNHEEDELEDFLSFFGMELEKYLKKKDAKDLVLDAVKWELKNHGFEQKNDEWIKDKIIFREKPIEVSNNRGANISLAFNDGLLNTFLLRKLLRFNYKGDEEEIGYKMAKDFVELGIKVPKPIFIGIYEKMF
jgi:hypothetical protein